MLTLWSFLGALDPHHAIAAGDLDPGILHLEGQRIQMFQLHPVDPDITTGHGGSDHEGARFDTVRHDLIIGCGKLVDTLDTDGIGPGPLDLGTHPVQVQTQVDDLGFTGGIFEDRLPLGGGCRHHQVLGTADSRNIEIDPRTLKTLAFGFHIAMLQGDLGTQGLESFKMQVYRAGTDGAAAGQGNARLAEASQQWSQHQHRGAHGLDQIIGGLMAVDAGGIDLHHMPVAFNLCTEGFQDLDGGIDVTQKRHVADLVHSGRQDSGDKDRQRGILGTADRDLSLQLFSTLDDELVQKNTSLFHYPTTGDTL